MIQTLRHTFKPLSIATIMLIFFAACNQTPPQIPAPTTTVKPGTPLGPLEVKFDLGTTNTLPQAIARDTKSLTYLPDTSVAFTRQVSKVVLDDAITNRRYVTTVYEFTNQTTATFKNLTFYAYNWASNATPTIGGTAFRGIQNSSLQPLTNPLIAQSIRPEQGVVQSNDSVVTDPSNAHMQAFRPSEAQAVKIAGLAASQLTAADDILEYGFVATNLTGGRSIPAGGTGRIAFATSFPIPTLATDAPFKYSIIVQPTDESVARVTRGFEETTAAAIARAGAPINATEVALIGSDTDTAGAGPSTVRLGSIKTTSATTADQLQAAWAIVAAQPTVQALNIAIDATTLTGVTEYGITSLSALETNGDASIAVTVAGTTITKLERSILVDEEMSVWDLLTMGRIELGTASEFTTLFDTDPNNNDPQQLELLAVRISATIVPKFEPLAAGLSTPSGQATTRIAIPGSDYFQPVYGCPLCVTEEKAFYTAMRNFALAKAADAIATRALIAASAIPNPGIRIPAVFAAKTALTAAILATTAAEKAFAAAAKVLRLCYKKHPECAPKMSNIAPASLQLRGRVGYVVYKNLEISNTGLTSLGVDHVFIVSSVNYRRTWFTQIPARTKAFIPIGWLCQSPGILNAQFQVKANNDPTNTTLTTIPVTIECLPEIILSLSADATSLSSGATTGVHASMTNDVDQLGVYWNADIGSVGAATPVSVRDGVYFAPIANPTNRTATILARAKGSPLVKKALGITIYAIVLVAYSDGINSGDTSTSGATNVLTASVGNDASSAGVTWSVPSGIGTVYAANGNWYYKAPLANPAYRIIDVVATSKADPSKTATTKVGIYPISVAAYADGSIVNDTSTSNGVNVLTNSVSSDASGAGVTWSVPSAIGTIYNTNGTWYYKAPSVNPTNRTIDIVATSNADPSKTATTKVSIYAITVAAYSDGTINDTSISGGINVLSNSVSNDASSAGVTWSVPSAIGTVYTANGTWHYKAPLVNSTNRTVDIVATSNADPSKTAITRVSIYAITVAAYSDGSNIYDTSISGGTNLLTSAVSNDASSTGVSWSVPSGIGTVYTTNGLWYYKAPLNSSVNQVVDVLATSKADTSKTAITKVSIYAITLTAYADGSIVNDTSTSGGINALASSVSNDASSSGVTWSVPSGIGTVYSLNGNWYYKAPLVNPTNRTVEIVATSNANPSKTATTKVSIYAITVTAYSDGSIVNDASTSGGINNLASSVSNDASSAGVTWSIYSGSGSISGTTFTAPVLSCYPRSSNAYSVTVVLQATSNADSSKYARTTITVYASQCP
jgi:hypothetical protein